MWRVKEAFGLHVNDLPTDVVICREIVGSSFSVDYDIRLFSVRGLEDDVGIPAISLISLM